jgi:hypothetical protein
MWTNDAINRKVIGILKILGSVFCIDPKDPIDYETHTRARMEIIWIVRKVECEIMIIQPLLREPYPLAGTSIADFRWARDVWAVHCLR